MKMQINNLTQTPIPKYLCEHVDHKLYTRKGMPVIGNWQERVQNRDIEEKLNMLAKSWYFCDVRSWIGKLMRCLYKASGERRLGFKLPSSPVLELKDLPKSLIVGDRNHPKIIKEKAYRQIAKATV